MDEPLQAALELCLDGDAEPPVTDGHLRILLGDTVLFSGGQQLADFLVGVVGNVDDGTFDAAQLLRSVVAQTSFRVENAVDGGQQLLFEHYIFTKFPQVRVLAVLVLDAEIDVRVDDRCDKAAQFGQLVQFDERAIDGDTGERGAKVVVILCGKWVVKEKYFLELIDF